MNSKVNAGVNTGNVSDKHKLGVNQINKCRIERAKAATESEEELITSDRKFLWQRKLPHKIAGKIEETWRTGYNVPQEQRDNEALSIR